jgi:cell division protein ZapA
MAQVTVTINGKQFRMACEDGQEGHLIRLADDFNERIDKLRGKFGEIGDSRLTVMAALTFADELLELSGRMQKLEEEMAGLHEARITSVERAKATQMAVSAALNAASERIENLTRRLNHSLGDGQVAIG